MTQLAFVAAFLLVRRFQKFFKFSPVSAKWSATFNLAQWAPIGIGVMANAFLDDISSAFLACATLGGMLYYAYREPDFNPLHSFIKAHFPLVAVILVQVLTMLISRDFYDKYDNYFQFASLAAFVWIFARQAATKKQQQEFNLVNQQKVILDNLVAERTAELTMQKNELEQTLALLQTTQQQLIQSEKLASLGELTAGIAHEIQNPLNFVNNFSEVSMEMMEEMEEELAKGDKEEAIAIAADIKQNLEKIIHHGKRADGIVKGMLQHSRASSTTKELTDVNALSDEYMRLSYHGLRAKDKSFNAELVTNFAADLPKINIVPQDIGRVLLNLLNNAFYSVHQKEQTAGPDYKPQVAIATKLLVSKEHPDDDEYIEITVRDNGNGIPDAIRDKIMQPFFTTKPTGEGTGLGLSLSFDIIAKGHGGSITIGSKEGEYSEFIIKLPL